MGEEGGERSLATLADVNNGVCVHKCLSIIILLVVMSTIRYHNQTSIFIHILTVCVYLARCQEYGPQGRPPQPPPHSPARVAGCHGVHAHARRMLTMRICMCIVEPACVQMYHIAQIH